MFCFLVKLFLFDFNTFKENVEGDGETTVELLAKEADLTLASATGCYNHSHPDHSSNERQYNESTTDEASEIGCLIRPQNVRSFNNGHFTEPMTNNECNVNMPKMEEILLDPLAIATNRGKRITTRSSALPTTSNTSRGKLHNSFDQLLFL